MKQKTCCFTGHRNIPKEQITEIKDELRKEIVALIKRDVIFFGSGGARGFDLLAAEMVLELKETYPQIKLIMILPCKNQIKGWENSDVQQHKRILAMADKIVYGSENYFSGSMQKRNRHMVNNSGYIIAYYTGKPGGTAYTLDYAKASGVNIIKI